MRPPRSLSIFMLAASMMIGQAVTAILLAAVARLAGPDGFSPVAVALAVGSAAALVIDFGTNSFWVREVARGSLAGGEAIARLQAKIVYALILSGLAMVLAASFHSAWLAYAAVFSVGQVGLQGALIPFRWRSEVRAVATTQIVERISALAIFGLAIVVEGRLRAAEFFVVATGCSQLGWSAAVLLREHRRTMVSRLKIDAWKPWAGSSAFGGSAFAGALQNNDISVLRSVSNSFEVGLYGAVSRWTQPMGILASSTCQSLIPSVAAAPTARQGWALLREKAWILYLSFLGCVAVALSAPLTVPLLLGDAYAGSKEILAIRSEEHTSELQSH